MGGRGDAAPGVGRVAVVGAGPRGVGWLERFAENLPSFAVPAVEVHLIDPFPPGGGRIWRFDQSPLLRLNSRAEDVTMFTDERSTIEGPVRPGPSLAAWAEEVRAGRIDDVDPRDDAVAAELAALGPGDFPTRRLQSVYLDWVHRRSVARLPAPSRVVEHRDTVVGVDDLPEGGARVRLASGGALEVDHVVYALGHASSGPDAATAALARAAADAGLAYVPPAFTADADLAALAPGEPVLVRGMGLAATDLIVLLTEGRGGRFEPAGDGLRYVSSGLEPRLHLGSRRGVPYRSKITSSLQGARPAAAFLTPETAALLAARPSLDFRDDVWPLIAKELLHGYYAELFTGHPDRVLVPWEAFLARFAPLDPWSDELRDLVAETVADPDDRLDLAAFDRPLRDVHGLSVEALQAVLRDHVRDDLRRRTEQAGSATLGLFVGLLQALHALVGVVGHAPWTARSRERDLEGWWLPTFSYIASGPPPARLRELLALSEAGIVTFLGADVLVTVDAEAGVFRAAGSSTDAVTTARALVDAWLPPSAASRSDDAALRDLVEARVGMEQVHADAEHVFNSGRLVVARDDSRVVGPDGGRHPHRSAIGPFTTAPFVGAFARPGTDAVSFRENDAVARAVLADLARTLRPAALLPAP